MVLYVNYILIKLEEKKKKEMPQGEGSSPAQEHVVQCGKRAGQLVKIGD